MLYTKGLLAMDVHNPHFEETGITASLLPLTPAVESSIFPSIHLSGFSGNGGASPHDCMDLGAKHPPTHIMVRIQHS
ncbi:hypothetical protein WG66_002841 [Moniliophthora roreri]|nr:hypothetical protein WG66_002841 [Moniliophthora roreri]